MNKLSNEKRSIILHMLVEGSSLRSITRVTGASINTVTKLLVDAGKACLQYHDQNVHSLKTTRVECDEIWSFVYSKEKNVPVEKQGIAGDVWTWTAIDANSKLIISYHVGNRDSESAEIFINDLSERLNNKIQLTTDGLSSYVDAVEVAFGNHVDFAQLIKVYANPSTENQKRYSPAECTGTKKIPVIGAPDEDLISTSYVERQNLTMRMHMKRFARLTNAFSKKINNHVYAIALHFMYYNYCKIHKTLRVTPAMEAGLTKRPWEISNLLEIVDNYLDQKSN